VTIKLSQLWNFYRNWRFLFQFLFW
jgi:hypothetical protein